MTKLILLHTVVVLHFTHHIKRHDWSRGGGGNDVKMRKKQSILYKPVGKYQFTMACIRALVMIVKYQVINCLISQPKHMLWVLKRTVAMRRSY